MLRILIALLCAGIACAGEEERAERAFVLTLEWTETGVAIKQKDRKEALVPDHAGMPTLRSFFFVLMDGEKNVHYSGTLADPRQLHSHGTPAKSGVSRLIVPELDDARRFVIYQRREMDFEKGRHVVLETDL